MKTCSQGCDRRVVGRGLCNRHYRRWLADGTLPRMLRREAAPFSPHPDIPDSLLVPLTRGHFAIIDVADAGAVGGHVWSVSLRARVTYAQTSERTEKGKRPLLLHRFLWRHWGLPYTPEIDHENENGLDCRRKNLRPATRADNSHNVGLSRANTSGVKGVSFCRQTNDWKAMITVNNKPIDLGRHNTREQAAEAYAAASRKYHGSFGRTAIAMETSQ